MGFTILVPITPETDEAARWLQRSQGRRSFKHGRCHTHPGKTRAAS
jgi:hypothetical protein